MTSFDLGSQLNVPRKFYNPQVDQKIDKLVDQLVEYEISREAAELIGETVKTVYDAAKQDSREQNLGLERWAEQLTRRMRLTQDPGEDITLSSTDHPFQIGADDTQNLCIDDNEIMARDNGGGSPLFLQRDAGEVRVGKTGASGLGRIDFDPDGNPSTDGPSVDLRGDECTLGLGRGGHGGPHGVIFYDSNGTVGVQLRYHTTPQELIFEDQSGTDIVVIGASGSFDVKQPHASTWAYNNTTGSGANMNIDALHLIHRVSSSMRFKKDIRFLSHNGSLPRETQAILNDLPIVTYKNRYPTINPEDGKEWRPDQRFIGSLAEDADALGLDTIVDKDRDGVPDAIAYPSLVPHLLLICRHLADRVEALEAA